MVASAVLAAGCGRIGFDLGEQDTAFAGDAASSDDATRSPPDDAVRALPSCAPHPFLLVCYDFDGNLDDGSGHDMHGASADVRYDVGVTGAAVRLAGTTMIAVGRQNTITAPNFTLEMWLRIDALPSGGPQTLFNHDQRYELTLEPDGRIRCRKGTGSTLFVESATAVPVGSWVHVACIATTSTATVTIAGAPSATGTVDDIDTSGAVWLGPLDGALDRFRFWSGDRTEVEICKSAGAC